MPGGNASATCNSLLTVKNTTAHDIEADAAARSNHIMAHTASNAAQCDATPYPFISDQSPAFTMQAGHVESIQTSEGHLGRVPLRRVPLMRAAPHLPPLLLLELLLLSLLPPQLLMQLLHMKQLFWYLHSLQVLPLDTPKAGHPMG